MTRLLDPQPVAAAAADALSLAADRVRDIRALIGFDGFIDHIIDVVDTRHSMRRDDYRALRTMTEYSARVSAFAGKSMNLEMVVKESRFGGNGPLLAGGLAMLGATTTYVGCVGAGMAPVPGSIGPMPLHPLYAELGRRCASVGGEVIPVAPPAVTHALEFDDGKVMQGDPQNLYHVTWDVVASALAGDPVGATDGRASDPATSREAILQRVVSRVQDCSLLSIVNWVMMPSVGGDSGIWDGLIRDIFPRLTAGTAPRRVFIDLCDPAKRTDADVAGAIRQITAMANVRGADSQPAVRVTLGLNLAEAERIDQVSGASGFAGERYTPGDERSKHLIARAAAAIRTRLGIDCVVIHPREGAAASTNADPLSEQGVWIDGPLTEHPKLSTGAGDHFNSGFALAQCLDLPTPECLAIATRVSGVYVRDAQSPTRERLIEFLRTHA